MGRHGGLRISVNTLRHFVYRWGHNSGSGQKQDLGAYVIFSLSLSSKFKNNTQREITIPNQDLQWRKGFSNVYNFHCELLFQLVVPEHRHVERHGLDQT